MTNNLEKAAENLFHSEAGTKIAGKQDDIRRLAESGDGQKVKAMLEKGGGFEKAVQTGDMESVRNALSAIMQTDEGARIAKQLSEMMK